MSCATLLPNDSSTAGYAAVLDALRASRRPPCDDPYTISVTELLLPPRIRLLKWVHRHELFAAEPDPRQEMYGLFGRGVHSALEGKKNGAVTELPLSLSTGRWRVTGIADLITGLESESRTLVDYKNTTCRAASFLPKPEWEEQTNLYARMAEPLNIGAIQVVVIFKDWTEREKVQPVQVYGVPLWSTAEAQSFLEARLALHEAELDELELKSAAKAPFGSTLSRCTLAETWNRARCQKYCSVAQWCPLEERP